MLAPMISAPIPGPCRTAIASIETLGAARLAEDFAAGEPGGHHPLVEPMPGVAERRVEGLPLAGGEPVERDREVVDADARHGGSFGWWWSVRLG